jgi:hypothetical protein
VFDNGFCEDVGTVAYRVGRLFGDIKTMPKKQRRKKASRRSLEEL